MYNFKILVCAIVLSAVGFFIAKAHTKFFPAKAYVKCAGFTCIPIDNATGAAGVRFTSVGVVQAQIRTSSGGTMLIYSNSTCTAPAYFLGC